ncbi:hypothetical protein [Acidithiobacillus thiooxidans]|jgi:hypothetical protein|uniref:hypothetical protein n=1 Tax=Acidithiobacillus thiooxidans TaxID=930 RepID=UPI001D00C33E|nr:hypothetical protein [Acidithiobacillus thiooxidans]
MSMKSKPDLRGMNKASRLDPNDFLEGAESGQSQASRSQQTELIATKPEPTIQKLFRLRWDVANALKMEAARSSVEQGRRVTETEIVEELIRKRCRMIDS